MSNLSELLPSGGGQNVVEFTASGAVASGKPVILNSDGTVTEVAASSVSEVIGSATSFDTGIVAYTSCAFDSTNNKVVIAFRDDSASYYGNAIVGTVSGSSISFGTQVLFESAETNYTSTVFDVNAGKIVIFYQDAGNSSYGTAIVGTVSGTSISFGSPVVFHSGLTTYIDSVYEAAAQKLVAVYTTSSGGYHGEAIVGTVSGTSISFGSAATFESGDTDFNSIGYDSTAQKVVIACRDVGNSYYGTAVVGTVSGTSISFGSSVVFKSANSARESVAYDSANDKTVIAYKDSAASQQGKAVVGTVSGTSISFGSEYTFGNSSNDIHAIYDSNAGKVVCVYADTSATNALKANAGTVSGTTITFDGSATLDSNSTGYSGATFDSNANKLVVSYYYTGTGVGYGITYSPAYTSTNLTAASFIGLASAAISDTASGDINVKGGINKAQTGLTIGSDYYVQTDGTLATTADTPSVKVGQAISATTINMMDLT